MMFFLILFVLSMVFLVGKRASADVQDEVKPSRKYITLGIDALLLVMIGVLLIDISPLFAILLPSILVLARLKFSYEKIYAPVSGIILGSAIFLNDLITIALICIVFNYLLGGWSTSWSRPLRLAIIQPLVALLTIILI